MTTGTGETVVGPAPVLTLPLLQRVATRVQTPVGVTRIGRALDRMLERAGSRLRLGELVTIWGIGGLIFLALGWLLAGMVGLTLVLVLVLVVPPAALQTFVDRRSRLFATQLPDVLKLTASSLRAGFSLVQGLDSVTRQVREPSRGELQRVLAEARLGRPVDEALEDAAGRIQNRDFTESVVAVRIQQETGGNLAALFDTLAETMVQRLQMRREVRTLTAEGRLSAYVLGLMPLAMGIFIFTADRSYELVLFHSTGGKFMLVGGLVLMVLGFYWMYRIVKIEV
jgi:tight adherence protein B